MRESNARARGTWEVRAVGEQRATAAKGSPEYFEQIRAYRYGYETPWIPRLFRFPEMRGRRVLEIGVGNGIDGVEMARHGAIYHGIDITANHLNLTRENFAQHRLPCVLYSGDLLETKVDEPFDVIYSFGVLHHIEHEFLYLQRIRTMLTSNGRLMLAVYSSLSFFNAYLCVTHRLRAPQVALDQWRSHLAERSDIDNPVIIKIRRRREVQRDLHRAGFSVEHYYKRGFVQNYIPVIGRRLHPDGAILNALGRALGWYHIFICR